MQAFVEVDIQIWIFLTSALVASEWSALRLGHTIPRGRDIGTHWIGWMGHRTDLDDVEYKQFCPHWGPYLRRCLLRGGGYIDMTVISYAYFCFFKSKSRRVRSACCLHILLLLLGIGSVNRLPRQRIHMKQ